MRTLINYLIIVAFFLMTALSGISQCLNSSNYPTNATVVSPYNTPVIITSNQWAGEFAEISNLANGMTYSFASTTLTDYVTIRSADNSLVLAHGTSPVSYTALQSGLTVNAHFNISASCDNENVGRETSVTCTTCSPPPGKTGINTSSPQAVLDVNGEVKIGQTNLPPEDGMLRYDASSGTFTGYTNGSWQKLQIGEIDPFEGSAIISMVQGKRLNEWIGNTDQKWVRCYQKTIDGATASDFHSNCDKRGPTVTIILLDNNRIFGGYSDVSWTSSTGYDASNNAFVFSIDSDKRYPLGGNNDNAVYHFVSYGPTFGGGHDFYINSSMNLGYLNFPYTYARNGVSNNPSNGAAQELAGLNNSIAASITELEVWILSY